MQLKKTVNIEAETTDGKKMVEGKNYIIVIGDRSLCGIYRGITKKSALMFEVPVVGVDIEFNIMPNSIHEIYEADINVKRGFMSSTNESHEEVEDEH